MVGRSGVKWLAVTVVVQLGVAVTTVACGNQVPRPTETAGVAADGADPEPPEESVPTEPVVGDVVPVGRDGSVAVLATEAGVNPGRLFAPPRDRQYYAVAVEGCSGPDEAGLGFDPSSFILRMADRTIAAPGLPVKKPDLRAGELSAGGCLTGWVTFLIPSDAEPVAVIYDGSTRIEWRIAPEGDDPAR